MSEREFPIDLRSGAVTRATAANGRLEPMRATMGATCR
jgi:hypothetical protein